MGETANLFDLISITSELSFTEHFDAKNSVAPKNLFSKCDLFIGQFIIPFIFFLMLVYVLNLSSE